MPTSEGGYKQFPLEKLFQSANGNFDIQKVHFNDKGHNVISAGESNNGIVGKTDVAARVFYGNTITIDMFGNSYYQYEPYKMVTHARVFSLSPVEGVKMSERIGLYVLAQIKYFKNLFSYDNMCSWEKVRLLTIELPVNHLGDIDFDFMESYIQQIEEDRIRELDKYFDAAGLSDCTLTESEERALNTNIENITLHPFKMEKLFYKPNLSFRKKKFNKKEDVSTIRNSEYSIPLVNAKHGNNGIMYYGREQDYDTVEMAIDIVNDGAVATGDVYPQPQKTGVLYNAYLIKLLEDVATESILMYYAATIQKNIKLLFSYQNKAGWEKVKDCSIFLPVTSDGSINYEFMENYINAVKKQTIARVKEYIEQEHSVVMEEPQIEQTITPLVYPEYKPGRIPLYTLRAACGYFDDGQLPEEEGWIDASGLGFTPDPKRHFAVHAKGDSMLPKIKDGDLCIFEWYTAGSRNGEIVLTQSSEYDSEYGGRYTIKRYHSEKTVTAEGWQHASVQLLPLNQNFDPIELDEFGDYRTIGIFKCTLK